MATLTTAELAEELETDTRTVRKFLRDTKGEGKAVVGKGARYSIEKREVRTLKSQFAKWLEARVSPRDEDETLTEEDTTD